ALAALLSAAVTASASGRQVVPVPVWSDFDGAHWGVLALGETTRAAFERDYSSRPADLPGVLKATTSHRTDTEVFAAFDAPGPGGRLVPSACFYEGRRGRPTPEEFESRTGGSARGGYPPTRRADWRLRVAAERGLAALIEREGQGERVIALLFSRP